MQKLTVWMVDHHTYSARELMLIIRDSWPCLKVELYNNGSIMFYDGEHGKSCTECKAGILDGLE
jgi:hypothetical protein